MDGQEIVYDLSELIRDEGDESLSFLLADHSGKPADQERAANLIARLKLYPNGAPEDQPPQWLGRDSILDEAIERGWVDAIPTLVKVGVNPNGSSSETEGGPLMTTIVMGREPYGIDYRVTRPSRVAERYARTAKALIESGAKVNVANKDGITLLHYASGNNNAEIVKLLVENGADVNAKDKWGRTPLHAAMTLDVVLELLKAKPIMNVKDEVDEETPFFIVYLNMVRNGYAKKFDKETVKTIEAFLNAGASINTKNERGSTVIDLIKDYGTPKQKEVFNKFLKERGQTMDEIDKVAIEKGVPPDVSGIIKQMAVPLPPKPKGENPIVFDGQTVIDFFDITTMNNPLKLQSAIMTAIDTLNRSKTTSGVADVVKTLEGLKTESESLKSLSVHYQRKKMEDIRKKIDEVKVSLRKIIDENRVGGRRKTRVKKVKRRQTYRKNK